jgi:N-acetyl-anhydromuramyl-L-alanine amidase AmpD
VDVYYSPNCGGLRRRTVGIVLHSTRSGMSGERALETEYGRTISWFMTPGANASAHRVIGYVPGQHAQIVPDDYVAWHAGEMNDEWLGIEFCQPRPADPFSEYQFAVGVTVCVEWCTRYGIEPSPRTIVRHQDTAQGKRWGKTDPGDMFPYADFGALVRLLWERAKRT